MARALLRGREPDGTIRTHPYQKWQGPHWTLVWLALIDYPPGDETLQPMMDQVYRWLLARASCPARERRPARRTASGVCGSRRETRSGTRSAWAWRTSGRPSSSDRLIRWQWPDGGWNCDKRRDGDDLVLPGDGHPGARLCGRTGSATATSRPCERRIGRPSCCSRAGCCGGAGTARLIGPDWGGPVDRIHFPIQFYDVLFALQVMAEMGRIGDARCADALRPARVEAAARRRLPARGPQRHAIRRGRQSRQLRRLGPGGHATATPSSAWRRFGCCERQRAVERRRPGPGYQARTLVGVIRIATENSRAVSASSISSGRAARGTWPRRWGGRPRAGSSARRPRSPR